MFKKTAWLAGALAACFLSLSALTAAADDGRHRHGGHGAQSKYETWYWHQKQFSHKRHRPRGKHYGHDWGYDRGHDRDRHHGQWSHGPQRRNYVYDNGRCRIVIGSGPYGHRKIVRCGPGYPVGRYIPGSLIHTHPPAVPGQVLIAQSVAVSQVLDQAPDGQGIVWDEPNSGDQFEIVPTRSYKEADGRYCREYQSTATVAGETRQVYGQACRQPDGTWAFVQ